MFILSSCGNHEALPSNKTPPTENTEQIFEKSEQNILIAYFSQADFVSEGADATTYSTPYKGNTKDVAQQLQGLIGGELFSITTEQKYPERHRDASKIVEQEQKSNSRPVLTSKIENFDDYDIIFVGYPIWWYEEPMAVRTFLEEYNFSKKTVVPFCTTLGADISQSEKNIKEMLPDATILKGITISTGQESVMQQLTKWLNDINIK